MTSTRFGDGPLGDLRVIEVGGEIGQWCGKLMADLGADVIKIEPPNGAAERSIGPFADDVPGAERSLHFWHYNTSKRGVTLDIRSAAGRELFRRLVQSADVLLESCRPGELPALGLAYEELSVLNPRLVMCSLTPFGQAGPWRDYHTSDLVHLAVGGQMGESGYDEADVAGAPPIAPGGGNAWHIGSHYAFIGIMSAVFWRGVSGEGQYIDASVHDACALTTEGGVTQWIYNQQIVKRQTGRHAAPAATARTQFLCADGRYVNTLMFGLRMNPQQLRLIAEWFGQRDLAADLDDEKYQNPEILNGSMAHVIEVAERFFAATSSEDVYHGAQQRGFALGPVRAPEDVANDEHFRDRGFFVEVEHPELGRTYEYPGAAAIFHASPWRIRRRAPLIGEDNLAVFGELGVTPSELVVLRESGTI
jgi:crotonobetainyl-CoA:carnitine CoA-transferase CaiB-like acyl-CoA transferase